MNDQMEARVNVGMGLGCRFIRKPLLHFDLSMSRRLCALRGSVQSPRSSDEAGVGCTLGVRRGKAGGLAGDLESTFCQGTWRALGIEIVPAGSSALIQVPCDGGVLSTLMPGAQEESGRGWEEPSLHPLAGSGGTAAFEPKVRAPCPSVGQMYQCRGQVFPEGGSCSLPQGGRKHRFASPRP